MKTQAQQTPPTPQKSARNVKLSQALKRNMARRKAAADKPGPRDER